MEVNATKNTIPALKIGIAYGYESGFVVFGKIAKLLRWLNVNATFETFEICGELYKKGVKEGIAEPDLVRLKQCDVFIHTRLNLEHFDEKQDVSPEFYFNTALRNYFTFSYHFPENILQRVLLYAETSFFKNNKPFLQNVDEINNSISRIFGDKVEPKMDDNNDANFTISMGNKHAMLDIKNEDDVSILQAVCALLKLVGLQEKAMFLSKFHSIDEAVKNLQMEKFVIDKATKLFTFPELKYLENLKTILPTVLLNTEIQLDGLFKVHEIVQQIKERKIKIPDEMEIAKIVADGIEVYPNIAFWEDVVVNPTICLRKIDDKNCVFS